MKDTHVVMWENDLGLNYQTWSLQIITLRTPKNLMKFCLVFESAGCHYDFDLKKLFCSVVT